MDFLAAVKASEGSAPSYSSYAQWESGSVTPRKTSLAPIRRYHAKRLAAMGQTAPEPTTATEPPDPVVAAIDRQTAMLKAVLEAIVKRLPLADDPETEAVLKDVAEAVQEQVEERRQSASLPRTPPPSRPEGGRRSRRRSSEAAG